MGDLNIHFNYTAPADKCRSIGLIGWEVMSAPEEPHWQKAIKMLENYIFFANFYKYFNE